MEVKGCKNKEKNVDKRKRVHLLERIMQEQNIGKGISKCSVFRRLTLPPPQISSCTTTFGYVIIRAYFTPQLARRSESAIYEGCPEIIQPF